MSSSSDSNIERIRELSATVGPLEILLDAPGYTEHKVLSGKAVSWAIHWQNEYAVSYCQLSAYTVIPNHAHKETQWLIPISGLLIVTTNGGIHRIKPGQDICLSPDQPHEVSCIKETRLLSITIPACHDFPKALNTK